MQLGNLTVQVCRKDSVSCRIPNDRGQHHIVAPILQKRTLR